MKDEYFKKILELLNEAYRELSIYEYDELQADILEVIYDD